MTECNGCGACCDPLVMMTSPAEIALGFTTKPDGSIDARIEPDVLAFMREHLRPLPRREALARVPWMRGAINEFVLNGEPVLIAAHLYECDRYDPVAKICTAYDERPAMCRDYPWYDDVEPDPRKALPPTCSYRADVGLPVEPTEVPVPAPVRKPERPSF